MVIAERKSARDLRNLVYGIYALCCKFSRGPQVWERALLGLHIYLTPKSCCISPLKVAVTLLSGSGKGA